MKSILRSVGHGIAVLCLTAIGAQAVPPVIQKFTATSVVIGETVAFHADVTDADGDLQVVNFSILSPGSNVWQPIATVNVVGAQAAADATWIPTQTGIFTARADVVDMTTASSVQSTAEVFIERRSLTDIIITPGQNIMYTSAGEMVTKENLSTTSSTVQSGGTLFFWAAGRVVLKSGFKAQSGSYFVAAVDHNMNGYSDMEEITDTDGDGIPDAWEFDHGLDMKIPGDALTVIPGTSITYLYAYQHGIDPANAIKYVKGMPTGMDLVIRTPVDNYYGVQVANWSINTVVAP